MINQPLEPSVLQEVAYVCLCAFGWPTVNRLPALAHRDDGARLDNAHASLWAWQEMKSMSSELCSRTTPPSPQVQRMGLLTITTLCRWDGKRSVAGRLAVRALASQIGPWAWASRGIWSMLSE
jgi:hypothetical protein